jgi:CheY-like chemotaxis protein
MGAILAVRLAMTPETMRLLVVDDAENSRRALARHFAAIGWEVVVAGGVVEALTQAAGQRLDAIVMNAWLPGFEGYEAAAIMRRLRPGVPIILTVEPDADAPDADVHRRGTERCERFRCFPKPLDLDALARAVEEASGGRSTEPAGDTGVPR